MISVLVSGALGKMGRTTCGAVMAADGLQLAAAVDPAFSDASAREAFGISGISLYDNLASALETGKPEVAVDFTTPAVVFDGVTACLEAGVHCVVGTTGLTPEQLSAIGSQAQAAGRNCFLAPNFAIGAVLMMEAARTIARHMPDCEIIELHHDQKLDAPSGTSLRTAELIAGGRERQPEIPGPEGSAARGFIHEGVPIHSVRLPGLVAHQEIVFGGKGQTLSLRHDSISRESFMPGVILAIRKVAGLKERLVVGLEKIM
ncbi:MAG: 4-hydroxy-tetrahydrodipicolinate reductase [Thermoleophilia bacterium]